MTRLCLTNIFGPAPLRNSINTTTRLSASLILTIPPTKEPPLMYVHLYPFFHPYYTINNQHNLYIIIILRLMQHSFFVTHAVQCNHCVCTKLSHKIWSDCSRSWLHLLQQAQGGRPGTGRSYRRHGSTIKNVLSYNCLCVYWCSYGSTLEGTSSTWGSWERDSLEKSFSWEQKWVHNNIICLWMLSCMLVITFVLLTLTYSIHMYSQSEQHSLKLYNLLLMLQGYSQLPGSDPSGCENPLISCS